MRIKKQTIGILIGSVFIIAVIILSMQTNLRIHKHLNMISNVYSKQADKWFDFYENVINYQKTNEIVFSESEIEFLVDIITDYTRKEINEHIFTKITLSGTFLEVILYIDYPFQNIFSGKRYDLQWTPEKEKEREYYKHLTWIDSVKAEKYRKKMEEQTNITYSEEEKSRIIEGMKAIRK
ncbi:hypothetical protein KAU32_07195 [bacterium]|nr:hypothetical protein [bacterium]